MTKLMEDRIPNTAKWVADFIQRIGFPIFMALAILAMYIWHIGWLEKSSEMRSEKLVAAIGKNTEAVTALRHFLTKKYD